MSTDLILRHDDGPVTTLTLNAPARLNALSLDMLTALGAALDGIARSPGVRVVILAGAGRAFCAGHDLREIQAARADADAGQAAHRHLFDTCATVMQRLGALPQPVIARVQGLAAAAGCQLAATCDLVTAAEDARFGINGINIGLFCATPSVALSRKIAPAFAFELAATGDFLTAARARDLGLVNRVADAQDLDQTTLALARTLAEKLPAALMLGKQAFRDQLGLAVPQAYQSAGTAMVRNLALRDTAEGIDAFLAKRRPDWA